jgi:hypothetical protein
MIGPVLAAIWLLTAQASRRGPRALRTAAAAGAAAVILYPEATLARWAPWGPRARALPASDDAADVERASETLAGLI